MVDEAPSAPLGTLQPQLGADWLPVSDELKPDPVMRHN